jgi:hypothetical protein
VNPTAAWALQLSHGRLNSPEQLEPEVDQDRTTASALYDGTWSAGHWQGMLAWGRARNQPGHTLDAFTAEASAQVHEAHHLLLRLERVEKDELFLAPDARAGGIFAVGELSAGYRFDVWRSGHTVTGIGALGTLAFVPHAIQDAYGDLPASVLLFLHVGLH